MMLERITNGLFCLALGLGLFGVAPASAEPLDVNDPTPRWIEVRFEISPEEEPGSLDRHWSEPRRARVELGSSASVLRIEIPAVEVEAQFRSTGADTIPGSFTKFIWVLDPVTGHVLEAEVRGEVREELSLGPFRAYAQVEISVEMNTARVVGYLPNQGIFGVNTNRLCKPGIDEGQCVPVAPIRFDPTRGYVNAVGMVRAASPLAEIRAFSPLGEVEFSERPNWIPDEVVSGPSRGEALCSQMFDRSCPADLGGEL